MDGCQQGMAVTENVENFVSGRAWWRDSWPLLAIVLAATGAFGLIGGLLISVVVGWLGRWRRVQVVAFWVLIPSLFITLVVVQSQRHQHSHEAAVEQPAPLAHHDSNLPISQQPRQSEVDAERTASTRAQPTINDADRSPAVIGAQPVTPTWRDIEWNAEVARFMADFPAVALQSNSAVFQEKLNLLYSSVKSGRRKLEDAYMAAIADRRWQQPQQVDRDAENARWDKDSSEFLLNHPAVSYRSNTTVFQEYLNAMARPGLTNSQLLELTYRVSIADKRWSWRSHTAVPNRSPTLPAPPEALPVDAEAENARWNADVAALFQAHPALNYQKNATILQEKLDVGARPGMTNQQMLEDAYIATLRDHRWSSVP